MRRCLLVAALLAAPAAFATGERVVLTPANNPLAETICFSMNCVKGGAREAVVAMRAVQGGVEFTVTMANGQRRLTHVTKLNDRGKVSSTDLVRATALVLQAIEKGPVKGDGPQPVAQRAPKRRPLRLLAHR
jgi:ribonuclease PH